MTASCAGFAAALCVAYEVLQPLWLSRSLSLQPRCFSCTTVSWPGGVGSPCSLFSFTDRARSSR